MKTWKTREWQSLQILYEGPWFYFYVFNWQSYPTNDSIILKSLFLTPFIKINTNFESHMSIVSWKAVNKRDVRISLKAECWRTPLECTRHWFWALALRGMGRWETHSYWVLKQWMILGAGGFSFLGILFKTWNVEAEKILEVKKVCIVTTFSYKKKFWPRNHD